jgi:quinoprotein glucose dehydrogenase
VILFLKIFSFFLIFIQPLYAQKFKIEKILDLKDPWSLTFLNKEEVLITEKEGEIILANIKSKEVKNVKHNLNYKVDGQGGLLDILKYNNDIFICYTEDRGGGKTSTSIAKAIFTKDSLNFKNIFQANPPINSGYHFGCRLVVKDNMIYASAGERGSGNIAQDPKNHVGKIIRINLDGSAPNNNPKFRGKSDWLSEIYQIGIRNPQGMTLSPFNNKIYISNHGAKGGDFFGEIKYGENYGWQIWCWGGVNYSGTKCGETDQWDSRFTKPMYTWTPSIAVSAAQIYKGDEFKEWNNHILITSLKDESIRKLEFISENVVGKEEILVKSKLNRIRDLKIAEDGKIYILSNGVGALWVIKK